jgi:hypothetical protein
MARQTISEFLASMKHEVRIGRLSASTEHHLRREFSEIGWDRDDALHAAEVDKEIDRLESQARALRELRHATFSGAAVAESAKPA